MWCYPGPMLLACIICVLVVYSSATSSFHDFLYKRHHLLAKRQHQQQQPDLPYQMCFTIPHLQALKEQFATYIDSNNDERASPLEIMTYLQKYRPDISEQQVLDFIARRDKDGDGSVDFIPDYLLEVSSPDFDYNTAKEWFELEDTNGDGYVSKDELLNIAEKVGMSKQEAEQSVLGYYMSMDTNNDQKLSWKEYLPLFLTE